MSDAKKHQPAESRWLNKRLGKFRLLSLLGQGAMGKVFLAEDTTLQRQVALKVVAVSKDDPKAQAKAQQFIREARAAAKINHPHIVNVLEIDQQNDLLYIAMDLVQGGDVKQLIKNSGRIDPAKACDLAADAADALAYGHRLGVIHRDVKPSNLMLTREGRCKLADFGLADLGDPNDDFRMPDGIIGTPSTIAPEVARGQPALPASDQYSLGCTVWHMLTGQPIFSGKNVREVLVKQANEPTPSLAELCPDLPDALIHGIETALAKDPEARHADCEVFARLLRGHSIALGPAGSSGSLSSASLAAVMTPVASKRQKTPWVIAGASVAALVLGGGAMVALNGNNDGSSPANPPTSTSREAEPIASEPPPETEPAREIVTTIEPPAPPAPAAELSPTPSPLPPPTPSPAAINVGPLEFTADQTEQIKPLVADDTVVSVTGRVQSAQPSQSGKTFMVKFEGNGRGDFQVIWKPGSYEQMGAAFGGPRGEEIAGQRIRVTGELSSMFGTPQIQVTSPDQIEIVD
ncbi:MAG: serine/threonine-protein kinase [Planctomycetota bacterium]